MAVRLLICLLATLSLSCSSKRLDYQKAQSQTVVLTGIPENARFGNRYALPDIIEQPYNHIPDDADNLVPRPTATIAQASATADTILLKDSIVRSEELARVSTDTRNRPSLQTPLPISNVDRLLRAYLQQHNIAFTDKANNLLQECAALYTLAHLEEPLFLCLQLTLEYVYIAAHAEDADNRSLDTQATALLQDFAQTIRAQSTDHNTQ